jgi:hypothetical protein
MKPYYSPDKVCCAAKKCCFADPKRETLMKKNFLLLILCTLSTYLFSQISYDGIPWSFNASNLKNDIPEIYIDHPGNDLFDRSNDDNFKPEFAGVVVDVHIDVLKEGSWEQLYGGRKICRLQISSGSQASGLYFSEFLIPEGASLYVYNKDRSILRGAYKNLNNNDGGKFVLEPIPDSTLIIEYNVIGDLVSTSDLTIEAIGYFDDFIKYSNRGFGSSGPCEVNVNCPEGNAWQDQRNGVARILLKANSSLYWCTGSLVNNTRLDNKPYFLTANHCGKFASASDYEQWLFYFNYQSEYCEDPQTEPESNSIAGASLIAKSVNNENQGSDFKLLLLNSDVQ